MADTVEKRAFLDDIESNDSTSHTSFSRPSSDAEDHHLMDHESLTTLRKHRRPEILKAWIHSKWRQLRYTPRRLLILILCPLLAVEFIYLMFSEPAWMTLNQASNTLSDQLPSSYSWLWNPGYAAGVWKKKPDIKRPMPIKAHQEFLKDDAKYLEAWVARGEVLPGLNFDKYTQMDGLWSWVNGSDPRHSAAREYFAKDPVSPMLFPDSGTASRFRSSDELRYSLRSARAALGKFLRTSHIVSTDFWPSGVPNDASSGDMTTGFSASTSPLPAYVTVTDGGQTDAFHVETGLVRYGQVPQWLDLANPEVRVGDEARTIDMDRQAPELRMHHDWSTYSQLKNLSAETELLVQPSEEELLAWKLRVLPTFNSMAMEASLGVNVTDLNDAFFYNCDDFYLGRNLTTADFSSPLYGPVFHIDHNTKIQPVQHQANELGEHPSLRYTAWLLGQRFGERVRNYILHITKSHIRPLNQEAQLMFGGELTHTAGERFRGGAQLVNNHLLMYNFVMERHREALLWSYFVARVDEDGDGFYSDTELEGAWSDLGLDTTMNLTITLPIRDTLLEDVIHQNLNESHFPVPQETKYTVSSQDGYALLDLNPMKKTSEGWPAYDENSKETDNGADGGDGLLNCWDSESGRDVLGLFKHVAFEEPKCGDFFIALLVSQSGRRGLSAFLPHESLSLPRVEAVVDKTETTPHLPLHDRWQVCDFSLEATARNTGWSGLSRRTFAMLLIQRYAYTVGTSANTFQMLTSFQSAQSVLNGLTKSGGSRAYAFMAINDDMAGPNVDKEQELFQDWMEKTWPSESFKLPYERP